MSKHRISKKVLSQLPTEVAEAIRAAADRYEIKSFTFENVAAGYKLGHSEGSRYTYIYGDRAMGIEMVSEANVGASGVRHEIGARVALPAGTTVVEVWYYAGFGMHVFNAGELALAAPK